MMVYIKNTLRVRTQRSADLDVERYRHILERLLQHEGYADWDLSVWLTNDATIRRYNKTYRDVDKPTDVLSFSPHAHLKPGKRIVVRDADEKNLGDLIISIPYVQRFCMREGCAFEERMTLLLVHGFCHLLGYDHATEKQYAQMSANEHQLIAFLGA